MTHELDPDGAESLVHYGTPIGDPDDPMVPADIEALSAHEAQDAEYEAEHAADAMLEIFLAGVAASDGSGTFGMDDPAFALGETVGWLIRGQIALKPELAPLWKALVK